MSEPDYGVAVHTTPDGSDVTFQFIYNKGSAATIEVHTPDNSYSNQVDIEDLQALMDACCVMRDLLEEVGQ